VQRDDNDEKGQENAEPVCFLATGLNEFCISPEAVNQSYRKEPEPESEQDFSEAGKVIEADKSVAQSAAGGDPRGRFKEKTETEQIENRDSGNHREASGHGGEANDAIKLPTWKCG
jgi:hypothetical protein